VTTAFGVAAPAYSIERRPWSIAAVYMSALGVFFYLSYGLATWVTSHREHVPSIVFNWELYIPFLAWTIVPYWSIDLFYCLSFFVCRTRTELDQHAKRLLTAQILSIGTFLLFPLRFACERPETHGVFGSMFDALASFDGPFNQAPSLHLSLAVILAARYSAHLERIARLLLQAWFVLIGVSVLTAYQHHFIDVPTGVWVGLLCCAVFPDQPAAEVDTHTPRHWNFAGLYSLGFLLLAILAIEIGGWALWLLWPAGACLIVAGIYWTGDPTLFRKREGSLRGAMQWLLAPYTGAAWLNSKWWTRHEPVAVEIADGVWLGRLPTRSEREAFGISSIVDLCSELPVQIDHVEYRSVPVLDLTVLTTAQLDRAVAAIEGFHTNRPTLVCCALGYSRSAAAVAAWLMKTGRAASLDNAVAMIRKRRKCIVLAAPPRAQEESIAARMSRHAVTGTLVFTARAITGAEARWVDCTPSGTQRIYFANHTSHADFILLWTALSPPLRSRTFPVAAADYWDRNLVRRYLATRVFRAVLVERDRQDRTNNPITQMVQALDEGNSLIVFPEGTRGNGAALLPFKCGIYHLAHARPNVELVPVWIDNLYRVLPKGAIIPVPLLCSATFGEPTHLLSGEDKKAFLARLHQTVTQLGATCAANRC
jgi:1-acyl-sn-glycerol-3-phosphate acyltransferase